MCPYPHLDEDAVSQIKSSDAKRKEMEKEQILINKKTGDALRLAIRKERSGERTVLVLTEGLRLSTASISGLNGKTTSVVEHLYQSLRALPSLDQCYLL